MSFAALKSHTNNAEWFDRRARELNKRPTRVARHGRATELATRRRQTAVTAGWRPWRTKSVAVAGPGQPFSCASACPPHTQGTKTLQTTTHVNKVQFAVGQDYGSQNTDSEFNQIKFVNRTSNGDRPIFSLCFLQYLKGELSSDVAIQSIGKFLFSTCLSFCL